MDLVDARGRRAADAGAWAVAGRWVTAAALAAALLAAAGCEQAPAPAATRPLVVTSFYPLYDFARQVAGDRAEVVSLVPAGAEPHDWEPSPRDAARLERAAVLVYNGAGFDPGVARLARRAGGRGMVVVEATAGLPLLPMDRPAHESDHRHAEEATRGRAKVAHTDAEETGAPRDPHVWLDPTLARLQVEAIRVALARADAPNADHYASRAARYAARLTALHEAFTAGLAECRRREIVVSHAAFTYLAHRYRLQQVPVMAMSPEAEPSPADLARAVRVVRRLGARVIFFETLVSGKLAETLAAEVGATTLVLNPVEGLTAEEERQGKDYVALMDANLRNLRTALECR
jgi:zinc transport system substrate-binding protein